MCSLPSSEPRPPGLERQVGEGPEPAARPDQGRRRRPEEQEQAEELGGRKLCQEEAQVDIRRVQVGRLATFTIGYVHELSFITATLK